MLGLILTLIRKYADRTRYDNHADMPDGLLAAFVLAGAAVGSLYLHVLILALPGYLRLASRVPDGEWGWQGWLLTVVAGLVGWGVWHVVAVAVQCGRLLKHRWYA